MNRRHFLRDALAGAVTLPRLAAAPRLAGALAGAATLGLGGCAGESKGPRRKLVYASGFSLAKSIDERLWLDFEKRVEAALPDNDVRLLIRGEAGPEEQMFGSLRRDRIQVAGGSFAGVAMLVPEIALLSAPFLFDSEQEVDFVMDRYMLGAFRELFGRIGLRLLHWTEIGWVNLYGKRPMWTPAAARGQRVRASASIASQAFVREIGADTITLPFSEVLPSLQTGLIDAGVTSVTMYALSGIPGEAPYYVLTRHTYDMGVMLASAEWYDGLSERERAVYALGLGGAESTRRAARDSVAALLRELPGRGVRIHDPSPQERATWRAAAWPSHRKLVRQIGGQAQRIYDTLLEGREAFARSRDAALAGTAAAAAPDDSAR
ncbi:MAG: TRAP transporter substrate-binding protein DctP [Steroidobacteraceae bacterium]|jgi:TRAP-type C4-dicarboxylate transport system substrate-binding protein|nr:TRAP transporter substrate-binding protein DctP [Steroidobacteraceae bacterium]